jgi:hypothetical protein
VTPPEAASRASYSFKLYVIPPPGKLDWSTPRSLLVNTLWNHLIQDKAPIGHLYVEFEAPVANRFGVKRVLTGMSRSNSHRSSLKVMVDRVGLGSFFMDFPGKLDDSQDALIENAWALKRERLRVIRVAITATQAQTMMEELEKWIAHGSHLHYGGGHRILRGEGAGCAEFGMHFLSIALQGRATHPRWLRKVYAPKELTGAPRTQNRVSILKLYREGTEWGSEVRDDFAYQTPDPELIFNWLDSHDRTHGLETVLDRADCEWVAGTPATIPRIEFEAGYPQLSEAEQARVWKTVTLK